MIYVLLSVLGLGLAMSNMMDMRRRAWIWSAATVRIKQ